MHSHSSISTTEAVGAADFNNDGLTDIFFSGNLTSCRLFVNKGDWKFEDVNGSNAQHENGFF